MNPRRPRRGAAAQPFAINRYVSGRLLTQHPTAKHPFQRNDIQPLEQFAPHRGCRNPVTADPNSLQCFPAQPPTPAHNPQLIAPPGQQRRNRDQQKAGQRIALSFTSPMIRHRRQCLPKTTHLTRNQRHSRTSQPDSRNILNRRKPAPLAQTVKAAQNRIALADNVEDAAAKVYFWNERKKRFSRRQIGIAFETLRAKGWLATA